MRRVGKFENYIRVSKDKRSWYSLPTPKKGSGKFEVNTIVNGGRNVHGDFIGEVVGHDKCKLSLQWAALTDEEWRSVLRLFDRDTGGSYINYVEAYDPRLGQRVVRTMYAGDRKSDPYEVDDNGKPMIWINCQCNLIEV